MKKYYHKFFLLILYTSTGWTHDLWIEQNQNNWFLRYGHILPHANHSIRSKYIDYSIKNIKQIFCIKRSSNDKIKKQEIEITSYPVILPECSLYFIKFSTGFWTQTSEGLKNEHPENVKENVIEAWESIEILKQIFSWSEEYRNYISDELEIVPLEDPLTKKLTRKILLKVFYKKIPVSGLPISYGNDIRGFTDKEGKFKIRLQKEGYQIIKTTMEIKNYQPNLKVIMTSALIFSL